ncbi:hypothetical protein AAF712_009639 [Marasmius tenuissimus]|uniref:Uncharacterized protein n=1 Tax=Marasmius tenuissimus TaxID=585030 RepID=A0ABR2ZP48_9AGAR|nr:hypothetical protein PM082_015579 [Marasmius tenuissimus]
MSKLLGKAGKALFEKHLEQYAPADPLYEEYTTDKGKKKRRKRAIPPGLSSRDTKILKSVQKRAHYLDKGFSICGFQFGWTFIIGIIPGAGDVASATLNYTLVVRKAKKADIPSWLLSRMLFNNAVSAGVGLVPLAGDVFLAVWKANSRNAALLEEFLRIRGEEFMKLSAEGRGPEAVAAASSDGKDLKAKGKGKNKGKGKEKQVAAGVTESDAEQVKPGSGMAKYETMPGGAGALSAAAGPKVTSSGSGKSMNRKGFTSFFAGKDKGKGKAPGARDSRFIEDVDGSTRV